MSDACASPCASLVLDFLSIRAYSQSLTHEQ